MEPIPWGAAVRRPQLAIMSSPNNDKIQGSLHWVQDDDVWLNRVRLNGPIWSGCLGLLGKAAVFWKTT